MNTRLNGDIVSYPETPGEEPVYLAPNQRLRWLKTALLILPVIQKTLKISIIAILSMPAYVIVHETGHVLAGNLMGIPIYDVKINWWEQSGVTESIPGSVPGNIILGCCAGYGAEVILALFFAWHGRQLRIPAFVFALHSMASITGCIINYGGDIAPVLSNNGWSMVLLLMLGASLALAMVVNDLIKTYARSPPGNLLPEKE